MGMWVLKRISDGVYVAPSGSDKSYTRYLQKAATYKTRELAIGDSCGNEMAVRIDAEIGGGYD